VVSQKFSQLFFLRTVHQIMSVSFYSNGKFSERNIETPCLCAQMAPSWEYPMTDEQVESARGEFREYANPSCGCCKGSGIEVVKESTAPCLNWCNGNSLAVMSALGLEPFEGRAAVSKLRRALIRARNVDLGKYERDGVVVHGSPVKDSNGVVELKPVRVRSSGLSVSSIEIRLDALEAYIGDVLKAGATEIWWC
jgi:hypothetical protein